MSEETTVAAASAPVEALLTAASKKVGWVEFLIPLIPVLAELLADILESCADTEEAAVTLLEAPEPWMFGWMVVRVRTKLRRSSPEYRALPFRERKRAATAVVRDVITAANDDPDAVVAAYRAVS